MIEYNKTLRIRYDVDVFVAGGGPSGIAAAVTAAECGARVLLVEKTQCFGGAATICKVPAFMRFSDGVNFLSGGIGRRIFDRLYGKTADFTVIEHSIDTEKLKLIYDEIMTKSSADFLFETTVCDVLSKDGKIDCVILKGREEMFAVRAGIYIDATGDGFLAVAAGAEYEKGDGEGNMMPGTLCTLWGDIDWNRAVVEIGKDPDNRKLAEAFEDGVFTVNDPGLPGMWRLDRHYGGGNIGHVFGVDGTDEVSITKGIIDARRRMKEYETYYNNYLEGYENAKIVSTADILGIRETRRILCEYTASNEDYFKHTVFEDEIGRYAYPMDVHSHAIGSKEKYEGIYSKGYETGMSYGISYRSLLPKYTENILVCGRCIGAEREMMGSLRVMPACFITGMAAGAAAAQALSESKSLRKLSVTALQKKLLSLGAYLPNIK